RADDFSWPRREIGREQAKGDTPVAAVAPDGTVATAQPAPIAPPKPKKIVKPAPPAQTDFFGNPLPTQAQPARPQGPRVPRPPANVGRSAEVPGFFTR
ncbi:MAG TPA: DUF459 domain-containing protein, partial [Bradyrhizobium sp.]